MLQTLVSFHINQMPFLYGILEIFSEVKKLAVYCLIVGLSVRSTDLFAKKIQFNSMLIRTKNNQNCRPAVGYILYFIFKKVS